MSSLTKTLTNIRRTPYQAAAAILVLTITFFVAIVISLISISFYQALQYLETRPQVIIFFQPDATNDQIDQLKNDLSQNPEVSQVVYVPQEEALSIYKNLNQNDPMLLELVTADILPASLEISTYNLDSLKTIAADIEGFQGVDEVTLRSDVIDVLNKWLTGIRYGGLTFISLMAFTSILIIAIIIGMKISGKHYEIKILELIGAKKSYIAKPFLLEGALYGLVSSTLAYVLSVTFLLYSTPYILQFAGEIPLLPTSPTVLGSILVASLTSGLIVGVLSSWIALKRYLKL